MCLTELLESSPTLSVEFQIVSVLTSEPMTCKLWLCPALIQIWKSMCPMCLVACGGQCFQPPYGSRATGPLGPRLHQSRVIAIEQTKAILLTPSVPAAYMWRQAHRDISSG